MEELGICFLKFGIIPRTYRLMHSYGPEISGFWSDMYQWGLKCITLVWCYMAQESCRRENFGGFLAPHDGTWRLGRTETVLCATGQVMRCPVQEKELGTGSTVVTSGRYLCSSEGILGNEGEAEHSSRKLQLPPM